MPWTVENRRSAIVEKPEQPYLTDELKNHLREKYFPRYPTKKAVLLPALHLVQHTYNWIPQAAMVEIAELLEIAPAEVIDTATFYEEYWLRPKGKYLIQVCRSLACEICGSRAITSYLKTKLNLDPFETTPDGRFTLIELECLGSCGTAPAVLVNEVLYENVTVEQLDQLLARLPDDPNEFKDPSIQFEEKH